MSDLAVQVMLLLTGGIVGLLAGRWWKPGDAPLASPSAETAAANPLVRPEEQLEAGSIELLFDVPMAMMVHTKEGKILHVNGAWLHQMGYTANAFATVTDWLVHATDSQATIGAGDGSPDPTGFLPDPEPGAQIRSIVTASGETARLAFKTVEMSPPIGGGSPTGAGRAGPLHVTVAMEVTKTFAELEKMQASENRYRIISELTSDVVFAYELDEDGEPVDEWRVGGFGTSPRIADGEVRPLAWLNSIHPEDKPVLQNRERRLRSGAASTDEFRVIDEDGRDKWLRVFSRPERDETGRVRRVIGAAKEITQDKRWEEALANSENKLQVTSQTARVGYWEYFPVENRTVCSPVIWQIWGLRPGRMSPTSQVFLRSVHPDDRIRVKSLYDNPKDHNQLEFRIIRPDGTVRHVFEDLIVDFSGSGEPIRFFGVMQDITTRKLAEEALRASEARYHAIVEDQTEMIRRCTPKGVRTFVNEAYCQYFGVPRERLIGKPVGSTLDKKLSGERLSTVRRVDKDNLIEDNIMEVTMPDGQVRWHHWTDRAVVDDFGNVVEVQGVGRDVTEMKRTQEELATSKTAAEMASAAKSRFLAAASHDLRQPMQALAMFVKVLSGRQLDDKSVQIIHRVQDCADVLERLLGSLLDISKLDAGLFVPQRRPVPVGELTAQLCQEIRPLADAKGLDLRHVPCSLTIDSDPGLLERIIRNLLSNAVRQTSEGKILIGCRRRDGRLSIELFDTGIGIPEDQLQLIFEEFHQVGNEARDRREGLGLGLAIVDRLARLLGHTIDVRSQVGKGSVFRVIAPLAGEHAGTGSGGKVDEPRFREPTGALVVAIDDEQDIRDALQLLLSQWGYEAVIAASAAQALDALERMQRTPDLVVADFRLKSGHTGADAILAIRHLWGVDVPGFLLTGDTGPERLREAGASGFDVMHKPLQPDRLREEIARRIMDARRFGAGEDGNRQTA